MENNEIKKLKKGFTTGSVATLATKAAVCMLFSGEIIDECELTLPSGEIFYSKINNQIIDLERKTASCSVTKPHSDDPDVTAGIEIFANVSLMDSRFDSKENKRVIVTGGEGIGIVTRPGLDQKVSEYAINKTPRKMISEAALSIADEYDYEGIINVKISAPEGVEIAKKTFNPHMGIEGGISIIGTTGVVEPMSTKALIDTILLDIKMHYEENSARCIIVPGNYGVTFLKNNYSVSEKDIILCSNYVGDSIKMAVDEGFKNILFCSHIGKLIKVFGGVMNTHSMYGDFRLEFMSKAFLEAVNSNPAIKEDCMIKTNNLDIINQISDEILNCVSTTAALDIIAAMPNGSEILKQISKVINRGALENLYQAAKLSAKYVDGYTTIDCIMYENKYGELSNSRNSNSLL